jgi:hypothetical protein
MQTIWFATLLFRLSETLGTEYTYRAMATQNYVYFKTIVTSEITELSRDFKSGNINI